MAALEKKLGTDLQTGADASPVTGTHSQTSTKAAGGELKIIHDETGADLAVYVVDPHTQQSFEAVLAASTTDKEIGDPVTIDNVKYVVTQWEVTGSNDDVKKVRIGLRSTDISGS